MLIKILKSEVKTSANGNEYKKADVEVEGGGVKENVAVFPKFSHYNEVLEGNAVEGVIREGNDPKWGKSYVLEDGNLGQKPAGLRQNAISKAQDKKAEQIAQSQEAKEHSIRIASTFTAAWNTAIAETENDRSKLQEAFEKWRKYYWESWDYDDQIPF